MSMKINKVVCGFLTAMFVVSLPYVVIIGKSDFNECGQYVFGLGLLTIIYCLYNTLKEAK